MVNWFEMETQTVSNSSYKDIYAFVYSMQVGDVFVYIFCFNWWQVLSLLLVEFGCGCCGQVRRQID